MIKINNKKGFVFTLDITIAMLVVFIVILTSLFFVSRGSEISISEHHLHCIGSDIITIMDKREVFDSLDHSTIENELAEVLPVNYEMLIRIEGDFSIGNGTIEIGNDLPSQRILISGKKVALTNQDIYLKLTYFIWTREQ